MCGTIYIIYSLNEILKFLGAEAKKALKGIDANVLGPARNTRSQAKVTWSQTRTVK